MQSHSVVCVKCKRTMKPERIGVTAQENRNMKGDPYKMWSCDKYKCQVCGHEVLTGFGASPLKHYDMDPSGFSAYKADIKFF